MDNLNPAPAAPGEDPEYRAARKYVRELRKFYEHLASYVVVNAFLVVLNYLTSPNHWWVQWVLFGWGIGIVAHGLSVLGYRNFYGTEWEERKIREVMESRRGK
ncbi:MAG: 2TM domain-containing protein [Betaproteobacteria bacterium]|nr:2TM domain-containing protein [Betaproteobacteria bacterium]